MANSVDPVQIAPLGAVWAESTLLAQRLSDGAVWPGSTLCPDLSESEFLTSILYWIYSHKMFNKFLNTNAKKSAKINHY